MASGDVVWDRWDEVDALFAGALERPAAERDAWLRAQCADDAALQEAVRQLLDSTADEDERASGPGAALSRAALGIPDTRQGSPSPGDVIDRYRLLGELGRGGMATVYEAERADGAYDQRVALKVMRRGLDTDGIVHRFLAERQILSELAHPNIARLLDGGATPDGRPYLVMERVVGEPISAWVAARQPSVRERLRLFLEVADAVREAHRRLVVHRDLKPSNILVDADGQAKLLDFGIAKLLRPDASQGLTEVGPYPLTRRYASPEQARGESVTTSSDIYQLGLLLHELLTGAWPLGESGEVTTPLRGDLGTIVRKALEPEPTDRYRSVDAMAEDIRLHLEGHPIHAHPAPWWLRTRKWLGRNRWAGPVAATLLLGVAGYIATLAVTAERLERERNEARAQAHRAERMRGFLVDLFRSADPFGGDNGGGRADLTVAEALAPAARRARTDLADDPAVRSDLLGTVASVLSSIDRADEGVPLVEEALRTRAAAGQDSSAAYAGDLLTLAALVRHEYWDSAAALELRAIGMLRGAEPPDSARLARALVARMRTQWEHLPPADPALGEEALRIYRALGADYRTEAADALGQLSHIYLMEKRFADAERAARQAYEMARDAHGDRSPATAVAAVHLADMMDMRQRHEEAVPLYLEAIEVLEEAAGSMHERTLSAMNNLAVTYYKAGRFELAAAMHRRLTRSHARRAGTELDRAVASSIQNLAAAVKALGRLGEADSLSARAHEIYAETTPDGHPLRAFPLLTRAEILLATEDWVGAADVAAHALEILEGSLGSGHYAAEVARCRLGAARLGEGRAEAARALVATALAHLADDERTPPDYLQECRSTAERLDDLPIRG